MVGLIGKFRNLSISAILGAACICGGCACKKNINQESVCFIDNKSSVVKKLSRSELLNSQNDTQKDKTNNKPSETIVIKFLDEEFKHWKEIAKSFVAKKAVIEYIPIGQNAENWTEVISISYQDRSDLSQECSDVAAIVNGFKEEVISSYPFSEITWNTIETTENTILLEWLLNDPYKKVRSQHNIAKFILTERGSHNVILTKLDEDISFEEREDWVKVLTKFTKVIPFDKAFRTVGAISLADRSQNFLDFVSVFPDWRVVESKDLGGGMISVIHIPSSQNGFYVTESVEVLTFPIGKGFSMDQMFEIEKRNIQNNFSERVVFDLFKESPTEIMFSYFASIDNNQISGIVRTFLAEQGFCRVCYNKGLPEKMPIAEMLLLKEQLEMIKQR